MFFNLVVNYKTAHSLWNTGKYMKFHKSIQKQSFLMLPTNEKTLLIISLIISYNAFLKGHYLNFYILFLFVCVCKCHSVCVCVCVLCRLKGSLNNPRFFFYLTLTLSHLQSFLFSVRLRVHRFSHILWQNGYYSASYSFISDTLFLAFLIFPQGTPFVPIA